MEDFMPDHRRIADQGWAYRMNAQGWVIYRNPTDGRWYTRQEAIAIIANERMQTSA